MDAMLRRALRKYTGLRHHVDQVLLGDDDGTWEAELKKFLRREPSWVKGAKPNLRYDKRQDGWTLLEHSARRIVSVADLEPVPFLKSGEKAIKGYELVCRARWELDANFGQEDAEFILEREKEISEEFRKFYFVFTGSVWRFPGGVLFVSYLYFDGGRWRLHWFRLERGCGSHDRLLRPGK